MQWDSSLTMLVLGGVGILAAAYRFTSSARERLWNVAVMLLMAGAMLPEVKRRWPEALSAGAYLTAERFLITTAVLLMFTHWLYDRSRKGAGPTTG